MDTWTCVVVCRRKRGGVDEVLVQWECSWVDAEEAPPGEIERAHASRCWPETRDACAVGVHVGGVDAAAVTDYVGAVFVVENADAAKAVKQTVVGRPARKRGRYNRW